MCKSKEKENNCIAKLTIVQISSSIQLPSFILMVPPWQQAYIRALQFILSLSLSNGPHPWVSSSLLWPSFTNLPPRPPPLSILFIHIDLLYRLLEQDYWSMDQMPFLCSKLSNVSPTSIAHSPGSSAWLSISVLTIVPEHHLCVH